MQRTKTEFMKAKKANALANALNAGAQCSVNADNAIVIEFQSIAKPDIDYGKKEKNYFDAVCLQLKNDYGLPAKAFDTHALNITIEGAAKETLEPWLQQNGYLELEEIDVEWDKNPAPTSPTKQSVTTMLPSSKSERYIKPVNRSPTEPRARANKNKQPGMDVATFLTAIDSIDLSLQPMDTALEKLNVLHENIDKIAPPQPASAEATPSFAQTLAQHLESTPEADHPALVQTLAQNLLKQASMKGTLHLSKIALRDGFNIAVENTAGETHGQWEKRTEALAKIVRICLEEDGNAGKITHGKGRMTIKFTEPSALYQKLVNLCETQQAQLPDR